MENKNKWSNIVHIVLGNRNNIGSLIMDNELLRRIEFFCVFLIFSIVSIFMTVVNYITEYNALMYSTLIFAIVNIFNLCLTLLNSKAEKVARYLFSIEFVCLFTYFIIIGEPEGFSPIWSCMIPTCGMILFGIKYGTILNVSQFIIIIFFFWLPLGQQYLLFDYTGSFKLRFPLLFLAFSFVGFFFEFILDKTQKELILTRDNYRHLYYHDALTGLFNRYGFKNELSALLEKYENNQNDSFAFMMADLDHFKRINDEFGHLYGDEVLKSIADELRDSIRSSGVACRWGGEEFVVLFNNAEYAETICNRIMNNRRINPFIFENKEVKVTLSLGLIIVKNHYTVSDNKLISLADANLYKSKNNGRDTMTITVLE